MPAAVPLEVGDPQHQLGQIRGPGIQFQTLELLGGDPFVGEVEGGETFPEVLEALEHFALQPLEGVEGHIEEVAAAAGGIQEGERGQFLVEGVQPGLGLGHGFGTGFRFGVGGQQGGHLLLDGLPPPAQVVAEGGVHQALDVGPGRVVGPQPVALVLV